MTEQEDTPRLLVTGPIPLALLYKRRAWLLAQLADVEAVINARVEGHVAVGRLWPELVAEALQGNQKCEA